MGNWKVGDFDDHHGLDLDHHYGQTIPPLGFSNNDDHDNHNDHDDNQRC